MCDVGDKRVICLSHTWSSRVARMNTQITRTCQTVTHLYAACLMFMYVEDIRVCVCTCMRIHKYILMRISSCMCMYMYEDIHVYPLHTWSWGMPHVYVYIHVWIYTCISSTYMCILIHVCVCTCMCMYMYIFHIHDACLMSMYAAQEWRNRTLVGHEPWMCSKISSTKTEWVQ